MGWIKYTGRTRLPGIPEDCVTISPRGSMGIASNLSRAEMKNHFCEIEYDPETRRLRLTLVGQVTPQSYCFREDAGHYRIDPRGAMKFWKILPSEPLLCTAAWEDGSLIIQLPGPQKAIPQETRKPARVPDNPVRKQRAARCAVWLGKLPCPECGREVAYRKVDGTRVLRAHSGVKGELCNRRLVDVPPVSDGTSEETKTPSCICDECGGCFPLVTTAAGAHPYSHRVGGHICRGIFREPSKVLK